MRKSDKLKNIEEANKKVLAEDITGGTPMEGGLPSVIAQCDCVDCVFNVDRYCEAKKIHLEWSKNENGETICECMTYTVE